jgi:hypothetical protein
MRPGRYALMEINHAKPTFVAHAESSGKWRALEMLREAIQ